MALLLGPEVGFERIQREALLVLVENLNNQIEVEESAWEQLDRDFASNRGIGYEKVKLEKIVSKNFHSGHKPSLINAPIDHYPNVSTLSPTSTPSAVQDYDQEQVSDVVLIIELMCKAAEGDWKDPEELVDRRLKRTAEATNTVMMENSTLNGLVSPWSAPPSIVSTNVFVRKQESGAGKLWFWQGARLQYSIKKYSNYY